MRCDLSLTTCDLQLRVFFFSSFSLFFLSPSSLLSQKISPLSRLQKKNLSSLFSPTKHTFFLFLSLSLSLPRGQITTTQRERNVRHFLSHKTRRYTHTHTSMSSTPNVPSPPPSDPFAPNPPPVPGILITKVRFLLNRFLKREKERETNNRNVLLREDHLSSHPLADFLRRVSFSSSLSSSFARGEWCEVLKR